MAREAGDIMEDNTVICYCAIHLFMYLVHRYTIYKINSTYTSYNTDNQYGLSNDEKESFRASAKLGLKILTIGGVTSLVMYFYYGEKILYLQCIVAVLYLSCRYCIL